MSSNPAFPVASQHKRRATQRQRFSATAYRAGVMFTLLAVAVAAMTAVVGIAAGNDGLVYLAVAIILFLIPLFTGIGRSKAFDPFEPIMIVALTVFYGTTLRAIYLLTTDNSQSRFLMMQQDWSDVLSRIGWVIAGMVAFCIGYRLTLPRWRLERIDLVRNYRLSGTKLFYATIALLGIGVVGVILYLTVFNVDLSGGLLAASYKRTAEYVNASGELVHGAGWQNYPSQLPQIAFVVLAGALAARLFRPTVLVLSLTAATFAIGTLVPFLGSHRTPLIVLCFCVIVVAYYYHRLSITSVIAALAGVVVLVGVMGEIRTVNQDVDRFESFADLTIGASNGLDAVRSTAIIERVPDKGDFKYGESYLATFVFFVPRAIWVDKPSTGLGNFVKEDLFDVSAKNAGWPPGFIAEAYINFGYPGIVVVPFLIGMLLRFVYETCRPLLGVSLPVTLVYGVCLYRLGFSSIELNLAQGVINALMYAFPLIALLWFCQARGRKTLPSRARS